MKSSTIVPKNIAFQSVFLRFLERLLTPLLVFFRFGGYDYLHGMDRSRQN